MKLEKKCLKCNKVFKKRYTCSLKEWKKARFCSQSCANSTNKNGRLRKERRFPRERAIKICEFCKKKFKVMFYREKVARFCSDECRWNGLNEGKSSKAKLIRLSGEYKKWRELVYERDDWTCQYCKKRGNELNPHHIIGFAEREDLRFDINNGITLCRECHYKFHTTYGFKKNNFEQLEQFLSK